MDLQIFMLFAITTFVVVFSPGPAAITAASQGAANGVWRASFGVLGIAAANAVYFALSATGIASLIIASHTLFSIIKWVGVAYLIYLGGAALFSKTGGLKVQAGQRSRRSTLFATGFTVEFANPKALLYFAAILPQFIDPTRAILPQILMMGGLTLAIDLVIYSVYAQLGHALATSGAKPWIVKSINRLAGSALLFAAFKMARVGPA
ncbi:MAG: LysE family translocator [Pseudomonadota bacterium]